MTLNRILSPWLNKDIILLCRIKRILHKKLRDNDITPLIFKEFNYDLKHTIKLAKINYFNTKFNDLQNDIKKTWTNINKLVGL